MLAERMLRSSADDQVTVSVIKSEAELCSACGELIADRFLLRVSDSSWHARCLRCCVCGAPLDRQPSCFVRHGSVYCRHDYVRQFAAKCAKCSRAIGASDWVRRAREQVYHLACFACDACKRQLSTGEEFALHDGRVLCKSHYFELLDGASGSNDENSEQECGSGSSGGGGGGGGSKAKTKRVRTTFTEEQLQVLQANFNLDSNPDGQDLERIAQITGLSKRVTQVWFQNSRARQKKYFNNQAKKVNPVSSGTVSAGPACSGCGMLYCLCAHQALPMGQVT
ncbi:LIM/homeobox protein arrowhead isoform X1 [Dermacentor variabilis]|uniref:LIM/homeobox protein arrowhead isoform X1 n=1 Tax=Dermacentor variabilis TaxID=34621 RepID=UPI003F5B86D3